MIHVPVLLEEVVRGLNLKPGQLIVDGTVGGGGHARAILERTAPHGKLLGFDRDESTLAAAAEYLSEFGDRVSLVHASFASLGEHIAQLDFQPLHGVLLDLGLSSDQLADSARGFSFHSTGVLDLRYDTAQGQPAYELLQTYSERELERVFREFGEEPKSRALARALVQARRTHPIRTVADLLAVVGLVKKGSHRSLHPATLVWQALRIEVNHELEHVEKGIRAAVAALTGGGRIVVISFHSGEDRIVKEVFREESRDCICPPEVPLCQCHHQARLKIITRKPMEASSSEKRVNTRARSAKLRIAEKVAFS